MKLLCSHLRSAGRALSSRGSPRLARRLFSYAIRLNSDDAYSIALLADTYVRTDEWERAKELYLRAVDIAPDYSGAWVNLGYVLQQLQRHDAAIAAFSNSIHHHPQYQEAHYRIAASYVKVGRLQDALMSARRAVSLSPTDTAAIAQVGSILYRMGHTKDAVEWLQRAQTRETVPEHAYNLGIALLELGELEQAEKALRAATDANRDNVRLRFPLAEVFFRQGHFEKVIDLLADQTSIGDPNPEAVAILVKAYLAMDRFDEALPVARVNANGHPGSAEAHAMLGYALLASGNPAEALDEFGRARHLAPEDINHVAGVAFARSAMQQHKEACTLFDELLAQDPAFFKSFGPALQRLYDDSRMAMRGSPDHR